MASEDELVLSEFPAALISLQSKLAGLQVRDTADAASQLHFNESTRQWQTLNTLMILRNGKRVDSLQSQLNCEKSKLALVEARGSDLEGEVRDLRMKLSQAADRMHSHQRSMQTLLFIVRTITRKPEHSQKDTDSKWSMHALQGLKRILEHASSLPLLSLNSLAKEGLVMLLALVLNRALWIDEMVGWLAQVVSFAKLSRSAVRRTRFAVHITVLLFIFTVLRKRVHSLLTRLRAFLEFLKI